MANKSTNVSTTGFIKYVRQGFLGQLGYAMIQNIVGTACVSKKGVQTA